MSLAVRNALLVASLLPLAAAGEPGSPAGRALVPRGRWHHEAPGPPAVRWSVLFRRTDAGDETRLLVETPGGRWVLLSTQPAFGRATREEVTDAALRESVARGLFDVPPDGTPECATVRPPDACVVIEGSRGRLAAPLSAFSREGHAELRRRAAAVVSPAFLSRLRGLAPALPVADLAFYADDFLALLDPALARPAGPDLRAPRLPGCAFDATFGWPCTADEKRREEWLFHRRPAPRPRNGSPTPLPSPGPPSSSRERLSPEGAGAPGEGGRGRS